MGERARSLFQYKGQDFRAVLEEIGNAEIPMPKSGRWATAGMVRTETADIAWRVLDAQYHGVPQRRRRIFLVADFGGQCAGEILFIEEGLRGDIAESGEAGQEAAGDVGDGVETAIPINTQIATRHNKLGRGTGFGVGEDGDPSFTLQAAHSHAVCCRTKSPAVAMCINTNGKPQNGLGIWQNDVSYTLDSLGNHAICLQGSMIGRADKNGPVCDGINKEVSFTLNTTAVAFQPGNLSRQAGAEPSTEVFPTLGATTLGDQFPHVAFGVDCRNLYENKELSGVLQAKESGDHSLNYQNPARIGYAVRRLTPTEALRLQGYPDYWLDIEGMSDTQKYRSIGNSVAIPCVKFVLGGIARVLGGEKK